MVDPFSSCNFNDTNDLVGNDEDIGALGSILSWDDSDDEHDDDSTAAGGLGGGNGLAAPIPPSVSGIENKPAAALSGSNTSTNTSLMGTSSSNNNNATSNGSSMQQQQQQQNHYQVSSHAYEQAAHQNQQQHFLNQQQQSTQQPQPHMQPSQQPQPQGQSQQQQQAQTQPQQQQSQFSFNSQQQAQPNQSPYPLSAVQVQHAAMNNMILAHQQQQHQQHQQVQAQRQQHNGNESFSLSSTRSQQTTGLQAPQQQGQQQVSSTNSASAPAVQQQQAAKKQQEMADIALYNCIIANQQNASVVSQQQQQPQGNSSHQTTQQQQQMQAHLQQSWFMNMQQQQHQLQQQQQPPQSPAAMMSQHPPQSPSQMLPQQQPQQQQVTTQWTNVLPHQQQQLMQQVQQQQAAATNKSLQQVSSVADSSNSSNTSNVIRTSTGATQNGNALQHCQNSGASLRTASSTTGQGGGGSFHTNLTTHAHSSISSFDSNNTRNNKFPMAVATAAGSGVSGAAVYAGRQMLHTSDRSALNHSTAITTSTHHPRPESSGSHNLSGPSSKRRRSSTNSSSNICNNNDNMKSTSCNDGVTSNINNDSMLIKKNIEGNNMCADGNNNTNMSALNNSAAAGGGACTFVSLSEGGGTTEMSEFGSEVETTSKHGVTTSSSHNKQQEEHKQQALNPTSSQQQQRSNHIPQKQQGCSDSQQHHQKRLSHSTPAAVSAAAATGYLTAPGNVDQLSPEQKHIFMQKHFSVEPSSAGMLPLNSLGMWRNGATGGNIASGVSVISSADGRSSSKNNNSHDASPNSATAGNVSTSSCGGGNTSAAESNLTPAEKAKANRDRNREHARNTRLRKKAYLEKLKITVDELCRERDTLVNERAGAASKLLEMHTIRTEVLMSFFALRSCYEKRRELWSSILEESCFSCVIPVTPYRSFPASEVQISKCQRTIMGIDGMIGDTASLHVLLNSLIDRKLYPHGTIAFRYTLVTEDSVANGNHMMARWVMQTVNAMQFGAKTEVSKQGMLCCRFNSVHKIIGLELMFDVMAFMLQLKQSTGMNSFNIVPNTVQTCQRLFDEPMVLTMAERPYTILQVNRAWEHMTGYQAEYVVGRFSCKILQQQKQEWNSKDKMNNHVIKNSNDNEQQFDTTSLEADTANFNAVALEEMMTSVRYKRPGNSQVINFTSSGRRFINFLQLFPLSTDSKITHFLALSVHHEFVHRDHQAMNETNSQNSCLSGGNGERGKTIRCKKEEDVDMLPTSVQGPSLSRAQPRSDLRDDNGKINHSKEEQETMSLQSKNYPSSLSSASSKTGSRSNGISISGVEMEEVIKYQLSSRSNHVGVEGVGGVTNGIVGPIEGQLANVTADSASNTSSSRLSSDERVTVVKMEQDCNYHQEQDSSQEQTLSQDLSRQGNVNGRQDKECIEDRARQHEHELPTQEKNATGESVPVSHKNCNEEVICFKIKKNSVMENDVIYHSSNISCNKT